MNEQSVSMSNCFSDESLTGKIPRGEPTLWTFEFSEDTVYLTCNGLPVFNYSYTSIMNSLCINTWGSTSNFFTNFLGDTKKAIRFPEQNGDCLYYRTKPLGTKRQKHSTFRLLQQNPKTLSRKLLSEIIIWSEIKSYLKCWLVIHKP